jgi:hypothetical protein
VHSNTPVVDELICLSGVDILVLLVFLAIVAHLLYFFICYTNLVGYTPVNCLTFWCSRMLYLCHVVPHCTTLYQQQHWIIYDCY